MFNNLSGPAHPLSSDEIVEFLRGNKIDGVIVNRDSQIIEYKNIVLNLDVSSGSGTHWTALHKMNEKVYVYFDSFGMPPPNNVINFMTVDKGRRSDLFHTNNKLQDDSSILCGYFVCYFLYYMNKAVNADPYEFINKFSSKTKENDKIINKFFNISKTKQNRTININTIGAGCSIGTGFDLVEKLNKYIPFELHMRNLKGQSYSFAGPNTKLNERLINHEELKQSDLSNDEWIRNIRHHENSKPLDEVDEGAMIHDVEYMIGENQIQDKKELLKHKHKADKRLQDHSFKAMRNSKNSLFTRLLGAAVGTIMLGKIKLGFGINNELNYAINLFKKYGDKHKVLNDMFKKIIKT